MSIKYFFAISFIFFSLNLLAQSTTEVGLHIGIADSEVYINDDLQGGPSYEAENTYEYGIKYTRQISEHFSVLIGLHVINTEIQISPAFTGIVASDFTEKINIFSIPVYGKYDFGKYFYVNGGPLVEFQDKDEYFDSQSGIGLGLGLGAQYDIRKFRIHLNPNFKTHAIIPFEKEKYHHKISQLGVQLGVGYLF